MRHRLVGMGLFSGLLLASQPVSSTVVVVEFSGDLIPSPPNPLPGLTVGDILSVNFTYDTDLASGDTNPASHVRVYDGAITAASVKVGSNEWSLGAGTNQISVTIPTSIVIDSDTLEQNVNGHRLSFSFGIVGPMLGSSSPAIFLLSLTDDAFTYPLPDTGVPAQNLSFDDFPNAVGFLRFIGGGRNYTGVFDERSFSATVQPGGPVPEPSTWLMMIAGLGGVGWQLRRRGSPTLSPPAII